MTKKQDLLKKKKGEVIREAKIESISSNKKSTTKRKLPLVLVVVILILIFILVVGAFTNLFSSGTTSSDRQKFIQEYESLNGQQDEEGNLYYEVSIEKEVDVEYRSFEDLEKFLEGETGIFFLGMATFSPCRSYVPILVDAAWEIGLDRIFYVPVSETEIGHFYSEFLEVGDQNQDFTEQEVSVPTLLVIKDGEIIDSLVGTSLTDSPSFSAVSSEDVSELKEELMNKLSLVISCSDAC